MILEPRAHYLVLHDEHASTRSLNIVDDFNEALLGWTAGSRISPIWRVRLDKRPASNFVFGQRTSFIFIGPVQPARLSADISSIGNASAIWATLGCFNIIIAFADNDDGRALHEELNAWTKSNSVACELWVLNNNRVVDTQQYVLNQRESFVPAIKSLITYTDAHAHPALKAYYQEHLVATATALSRAASVYPQIYDDLLCVVDTTSAIMGAFREKHLEILEMQSRLLTMNAALSRFSSQAFSGTPPIHGTECHFWIHSLLGTGSANFALANLVSEVQQVLGEAKIPERLEELSKINTNVPSLGDLTTSNELLSFDIIGETHVEQDDDRVIPLVTYFSGRDGFSSHVQTLSAPLTTLAECNSFRSNLLTVTHEIAHIIVQSALAVLSPTPGNVDDFERAIALLAPRYQARNFLEAAQQLYLEAILSVSQSNRPGREPYKAEEIAVELPMVLERNRAESQEILVHTFDFLYFHAGDPNYYISNIWHSWCAIPGISDRVSDYLMRTLCAVSAVLLKEKPALRFPAALRSVKEVLAEVEPKIGIPNNYVTSALAYISTLESRADLYLQVSEEYGVRMRLVRLVHIFLYSDTLSAKLFQDPHIGGGEGYRTKRSLTYDTAPVGNSLQFLRTYLKASPTEAESMWILHCLAFDCATEPT